MSREDKQGIAIIAILVLLGISAFTLSYVLKPKKYVIDKESMCLKDEVVEFNKIVIIDKSDKWDSNNIDKISKWLSTIDRGVPTNSRLNILSILGNDKKGTNIKTFFDKCSPGNEKDCNTLYENCRDIREEYNDAFEEPLQKLTKILAEPGESQNSPLFETMIQVVDGVESKKVEIHIISDFMENGYKFNFYKEIPNVDKAIKEYSLSSKSKIFISMYVIERRKHKRELLDKVRKFWEVYFEKQGIEVKVSKRFFISD